MEIPKDKIVELLKERGNHDQASQAEGELPDQVDPERDGGMLSKFGLDPADLVKKFAGDQLGGLGGKLGL